MDERNFSRRGFVRASVATGVSSSVATWPVLAGEGGSLKFGVIADVHQDIMHDAEQRLGVFAEVMREEAVDFVVQLGDFCVPKEGNAKFLEIWNSIDVPRYHVLGNHDTDGGYSREETVEWWGMPGRYYSFDRGGMHFVVLDGNDRPEGHRGGYPRFIAEDQLEWLTKDLDGTQLRTVVFVHQSLERENEGGVQNGAAVRQVLESAGSKKVVACFSGHHHRDYVREINGIAYPQINSASYFWVGGDFKKVRYSAEVDASHPWIKYTVPYEEALFGIVTVDLERGVMGIEGRESSFVGPAPWELGRSKEEWDAATLRAGIGDREISIGR